MLSSFMLKLRGVSSLAHVYLALNRTSNKTTNTNVALCVIDHVLQYILLAFEPNYNPSH